MDLNEAKQLDAKRLSVKEFGALDSILRGRGSSNDETVIQDAIDRELKSKK